MPQSSGSGERRAAMRYGTTGRVTTGRIYAAPDGLHSSRRDTLTRTFFEKSKFSDFSTRSGVCYVKNARNPQRIPVLFALHPLEPYEKSAHFFVFRKAFKNCRR